MTVVERLTSPGSVEKELAVLRSLGNWASMAAKGYVTSALRRDNDALQELAGRDLQDLLGLASVEGFADFLQSPTYETIVKIIGEDLQKEILPTIAAIVSKASEGPTLKLKSIYEVGRRFVAMLLAVVDGSAEVVRGSEALACLLPLA